MASVASEHMAEHRDAMGIPWSDWLAVQDNGELQDASGSIALTVPNKTTDLPSPETATALSVAR